MTKYYYDGAIYSEKDWDFDLKRPKVKGKKADIDAEPETQVEAIEVNLVVEDIKE